MGGSNCILPHELKSYRRMVGFLNVPCGCERLPVVNCSTPSVTSAAKAGHKAHGAESSYRWCMHADALTQELDAKLRITEELVPEQALTPTEDLSPLQQLLRLCNQQV